MLLSAQAQDKEAERACSDRVADLAEMISIQAARGLASTAGNSQLCNCMCNSSKLVQSDAITGFHHNRSQSRSGMMLSGVLRHTPVTGELGDTRNAAVSAIIYSEAPLNSAEQETDRLVSSQYKPHRRDRLSQSVRGGRDGRSKHGAAVREHSHNNGPSPHPHCHPHLQHNLHCCLPGYPSAELTASPSQKKLPLEL
jgi:hypothetical protein